VKGARRFLVVRTDRIGDVVLSTPVLTAIKKSFPGAETAMLINSYTAEVISGHPDLDFILTENRIGFFRLIGSLRTYHFDAALILHPTLRLALLCWLAGIPRRFGSGYRLYSFLFNKKVFHHRKKSDRHECDLNMDIAAAAGAVLEDIEFKFSIPEEAQKRIKDLLSDRGIDPSAPYTVIHPGSGGSALDWPPVKFGQLGSRILSDLDIPVVVTGATAEEELVDRVVKGDHRIVRLDGQLNIKELAALLRLSSLVVANSTGPLHIAVAVSAPVIGLYCPIDPCKPERWGPYGQIGSVFLPPVGRCSTCNPDRCEHGDCMDLISVDEVFSMAVEKLEKGVGK
jgi:ADP-heptose:LPS heptosyltransferase